MNTNKFKYCPKCGSFEFSQNRNGYACEVCRFKLYINAAAAVAAIITNERGDILLAVRGRDPFKGAFDLPGGFVDIGERAEEALIREVKEELNLDVIAYQYLSSFPNIYEYQGMTYYPLDLGYICKVKSLKPIQALDDVTRFVFISPEAIDSNKIGFESTRNMIQAYVERRGKKSTV